MLARIDKLRIKEFLYKLKAMESIQAEPAMEGDDEPADEGRSEGPAEELSELYKLLNNFIKSFRDPSQELASFLELQSIVTQLDRGELSDSRKGQKLLDEIASRFKRVA